LAFGFTVAGRKRLLLVNTGALNATGVVVAGGAAGATHSFVDEAHGHGDVPRGQETIVSAGGEFDVGAFGVSVLSWP
jgi:hypothetical protein